MKLFFQENKRLLMSTLPLVILNVVLVMNFFVVNFAESQSIDSEAICKNVVPVATDPQTVIIRETLECLPGCKEKSSGDIMFAYYGDDANLWGKYYYGREGSVEIGGNLVVNKASGFNINGRDNGGYHWLMTSFAEPYGNALGFYKSSREQKTIFGGNAILNNDLRIDGNKIIFEKSKDSHSIEYYYTNYGLGIYIPANATIPGKPNATRADVMAYYNQWNSGAIKFDNYMRIFDKRMCGFCETDNGLECDKNNSMDGFRVYVGGLGGAFGKLNTAFKVNGLFTLSDEFVDNMEREESCDEKCAKRIIYLINKFDENVVSANSYVGPTGSETWKTCNPPLPIYIKICPWPSPDFPYKECGTSHLSENLVDDCECAEAETDEGGIEYVY